MNTISTSAPPFHWPRSGDGIRADDQKPTRTPQKALNLDALGNSQNDRGGGGGEGHLEEEVNGWNREPSVTISVGIPQDQRRCPFEEQPAGRSRRCRT